MTAIGLDLLADVRVVDFTQALSGPYCTLMLADLGADVVKVEPPGRGDDSRHWGPPYAGEDATYFMAVNRNKRSVALDLKTEHGLASARALVDDADVVVENWRPGTAARLGLGAESLRTQHPRLVFCSISGFGQDQGTRSGYDQILQGTSGVMSLTGPPGEPTKWGVPVGDLSAGMFATTAILAALHDRARTGVGRDHRHRHAGLPPVHVDLPGRRLPQRRAHPGHPAQRARQHRAVRTLPRGRRVPQPLRRERHAVRSGRAGRWADPPWPRISGSAPTRTGSPTAQTSRRPSREPWPTCR